ncbi:MAG: DUF898 domain-containing protein [Clostridia bacterium]|nr:DUF898 domain-containing protein [Clostridia bacterium]
MQSQFTGNTLKLFLYLLLLVIGTVFTLGIAYPWLMCLIYRWEIKNTLINGRRQYFDGKGSDLFKKYIKWLLLTIVTFGIYKICLTKNIMVWKTSHTHFEGNTSGVSVYKCGIVEKLLMLVKYYAIIICTLTIGYSWAHCYETRWMAEHTVIDGCRLGFNGKGINYLGKLALSILLVICTAGIYVIWLPVKFKKWEVEHTFI